MTIKNLSILILLLFLVYLMSMYFSNPKEIKVTSNIQTFENQEKILLDDLSGTYVVDTDSSKIFWEGKKVLIPWVDTGTIKLKSGSIVLDGINLKNANLVFDMNSISALTTGAGKGHDKLVEHLKSDAFFDVTKYPESRLVLSSFTKNENNYVVTGSLTIKDKTNEIVVPVVISRDGQYVVAKGEVTVDRSKFDIRYASKSFFSDLGDKVIDDNFKINFEVRGTRI